ncbi:MAG TPA: dihydrodipicolinate reductase C-terminal domain-containing protein [Nitriliruptorales bacterium]|nr:dihydrodipicolinate reductase C-terminal domain-containing protein [Nitriliruptorales bacterium]
MSEAAAAAGWRVGLTAGRDGWAVIAAPDVLVDASHRSAIPSVVEYCEGHRLPLVSTSSGLTHEDDRRLEVLAETVAVVRASNLALGHFLQRELIERLAVLLDGRGKAELTVAERHQTTKPDRPSATALALAALWQEASGTLPASVDSVRGGLRVSDHTVTLALEDEELAITHSVGSIAVPARRAVEAAAWVRTVPAGLYAMADVYQAADPALSKCK